LVAVANYEFNESDESEERNTITNSSNSLIRDSDEEQAEAQAVQDLYYRSGDDNIEEL
jgi:hypothetical protein